MSQSTLFNATAGDRAAIPAALFRILPWVFVCLGCLAPLVLVLAAALGSDSAAVRAQMIVQGSEMLAISLMLTVVLSLLYALGEREAAFVTAGAPKTLNGITTA